MTGEQGIAQKKEKAGPSANESVKISPRDVRTVSGVNQTEFWERVGITQSGGSRYENGERKVPKALAHILRLTYIEHVDLKDVSRDNIDVAMLLKRDQPDLYLSLLKEAKLRRNP